MSRLGHTSVLVFASLLSFTLNVRAQQPLNQQRGYDPTAAYSGSGIDNVNLFGGNLSMAIPLGQRYTVGPTLSYGFTLVYNSHVWDFKKSWCTPGKMSTGGEWGVSATPTKASNAGLGWFLSLGFLSVDDAGNIVAYIDPGGGEHVFFQKLHEDDGPGDASFRYTRDGSYLRLHTTSNAATVEFPDGTVHTFWPSGVSTCTPTTCDWRIRQMADRFSNAVTVTWNDTASPPTWTVSDSTGRSHTITMATSPTGIARVSSVSLAAFGGTSATYSFSYPAADVSIETSMLTSPACYGWPVSATVTFLVGIGLPDGSAYSMLDASGAPAYHLASADNTDTSGAIKQIRLPTGGVSMWTYAPWHLPSGCLYGWRPDLTNSLGIAARLLCDSSGSNCTTWTYTRPTPDPNDPDVTTTVTSPPAIADAPGSDGTGNDTIYYFRTNSCSSGASDYSAWDYGLGYSQDTTDGLGHWLSSRSYQGSASSGTLKRSTFVAYEHDKLLTLTYPPGGSADTSPWWSTNRRLAYTRTVYSDDANTYADVVSTSFDGLGHYRQAETNGDFDAGNQRTTFTGFNPDPLTASYRTYRISTANAQIGTWDSWVWPTSKPWILGTYNVTSQTENGVTAYQEACFERDGDSYPSTGFLRAARVMNAATEEKTDLLTVFTRDSLGQVISEQYLGGDVQAEELPTYCSGPTSRVSGDQLRIDHTYQYRTLRTSTSVDGSGQAFTFKSLDLDIDRNTGLPSASRDSAGIQTTYVYDSMARLTWAKPASGHGAYVQHQYLPWSTSDAARIESCTKANGTTTACTSSTDSLTRSSVRFDDFGRPYLEKTRLPSVTGELTVGFAPYEVGMSEDWTQRKATFGPAGWVHWTSEWYPNGTADAAMSKTTSTSFDPFGRPGTITVPDTKTASLSYLGVRQVTRTVKVQSFDANGQNPTERDATTTEVYDRQGRLYQLTEPSGAAGANVTTTYTYDVGNRLTTISTVSAGTTQTRTFSYDNRGLLRVEDLPEKMIPAGQSHDVTYMSYDAAGHARRVIDGPNDLTMIYDRAGRLTNVAVTSGSSLQDLAYSTANSAGNYSKGKLLTATRHNRIDGIDNQVVQTYAYGGKGGRVSQRTTSVEGRTIVQSFTWDDLGQLATLGYPDDSGLAVDPVRTISPAYTKGWLTAVPGFASALSYAVNGMPATITFANGVTVSQGLDPSNLPRIASIATSGASSSWGTGAYAFDGSGNIKSIGSGASKQEFVYDKVSRLVSGQALAGTTLKTQSAAYDAFGNITSTTTTDWGAQTFSVDTATNRLNAPVTYDAAGNMTSWGGHTYAFDSLGQVQRVTGTGINHTFLYTADGERIADRDATRNATTLTVRDLGGKVLRSWVKSGTAVAWVKDYVYAGGSLLASVAADPGEGTRYYALDHLGTPRVVTDACKTVVAQHAYYPFGMEATSSSQDTEQMKFTGHARDLMGTPAQTDDLDNMHARSYNPNILRLISVDPLRGNPHSPQSFNLFAYAMGNPVNYTDPLGLKGLPCAPGNARGDDCDETPTPLVQPAVEQQEEDPVGRVEEEISVEGTREWIQRVKGGTSPVPMAGGHLPENQHPMQEDEPARRSGFSQCFWNHHLGAAVGDLLDSPTAARVANIFTIGGAISVGGDVVATIAKRSATPLGGASGYASGINWGARRFAQSELGLQTAKTLGLQGTLQPGLTAAGNVATWAFRVTLVFSLAYDATTAAQCGMGILE